MVLKERGIKTVTLPIISKVKEVVNILRKEKNHFYLGVLCKGFQKIGYLKWTLMDIIFQLATDCRESIGWQ